MRRALALVVLLATAWVVRVAAGEGQLLNGTALALGFALVAALLVGGLFERLRLPRVTGYLLFGLACGPYVANLITRPMARDLKLVTGLAVVLIAFIAGLEINVRQLATRLVAISRFSGAVLGVMYVLLGGLFWIAWPWLPVLPEATGHARLAVVALLTTLVTSFSPTVTMAVIAESRAAGRFCELMVAIVILSDLALILFFTLTLQYVRWAMGDLDAESAGLFARLLWEIPGSLAFGALLGALFAFYLKRVGREVTLVLLALCVLLSEVGRQLHFESVLAALSAGLVVENIAPPQGHALRDAVERGALPVLIVFFAAAGASIQLDALATIGIVAVALVAARLGAILAGTSLGARVAALEPGHTRLVWMGLVSQAGVTLGLASIVAAEFSDWGQPLITLVVAMVAMHEVVGPVLLKTALVRVGEVGRLRG